MIKPYKIFYFVLFFLFSCQNNIPIITPTIEKIDYIKEADKNIKSNNIDLAIENYLKSIDDNFFDKKTQLKLIYSYSLKKDNIKAFESFCDYINIYPEGDIQYVILDNILINYFNEHAVDKNKIDYSVIKRVLNILIKKIQVSDKNSPYFSSFNSLLDEINDFNRRYIYYDSLIYIDIEYIEEILKTLETLKSLNINPTYKSSIISGIEKLYINYNRYNQSTASKLYQNGNYQNSLDLYTKIYFDSTIRFSEYSHSSDSSRIDDILKSYILGKSFFSNNFENDFINYINKYLKDNNLILDSKINLKEEIYKNIQILIKDEKEYFDNKEKLDSIIDKYKNNKNIMQSIIYFISNRMQDSNKNNLLQDLFNITSDESTKDYINSKLLENYNKTKNYNEAIKVSKYLLEKYKTYSKSYLEIHLSLADLYSKIDDKENTIKTYENAINIDPNNSSVYILLAKYYTKNGEIEKALINFNKANDIENKIKSL